MLYDMGVGDIGLACSRWTFIFYLVVFYLNSFKEENAKPVSYLFLYAVWDIEYKGSVYHTRNLLNICLPTLGPGKLGWTNLFWSDELWIPKWCYSHSFVFALAFRHGCLDAVNSCFHFYSQVSPASLCGHYYLL